MQRLDLHLPTSAQNLAADEALLDWCEAGQGDETLIFWEPNETFVVVGYANKVDTEVDVAACAKNDVPVFRRCSGGGTIVQMPGGLNYSVILRITDHGSTRNISAANEFIMQKNCRAIQSVVAATTTVSVRGHTDLTISKADWPANKFLKIAGNSQRRRKNFLLFHGTFLLNCDLRLISNLLQMPSLEPDYRGHRAHGDFVTNLELPPETVKTALAREWNATNVLAAPPVSEIQRLTAEKYITREWNYKF